MAIQFGYNYKLNELNQPYAGHLVHRNFIHFTQLMDGYRQTNVLEAIPELESELKPLDISQLDIVDQSIYKNTGADYKSEDLKAFGYFRRGLQKREQGDHQAAEKDFKTAVEMNEHLFNLIPEHWWLK